VIGASGNVEGDEHAFDWQSGKMHDLGALSGDSSSIALGINTAGLIVGSSESNPSNEQAVLWNGTNITNLNTLLPARSGWDLTEADAINSLGQIAGIGLYNGQQSAFLLDPPNFKELNASIIDLIAPSSSVPEPVSAATFLGLTSLFFLDRRHRSGRVLCTSYRAATSWAASRPQCH
jgi:probable HAF family extracellular repeat protein